MDHAWVIITAVASIVGVFVAFLPAVDAVRNMLYSKVRLREEVLRSLPTVDSATLEEASVLPLKDNQKAQRRDYFSSHSRPLSHLKQEIGAYTNPLLDVLRELISENRIGMWIDREHEITPDFVVSKGANDVTRASRPRFFKGHLPPDLRAPDDQINSLIKNARSKRNPVLSIALGTSTALLGATAAIVYLSQTPASAPLGNDCPGTFFSGTENKNSNLLQWDLRKGLQTAGRKGTVDVVCNSKTLVVTQTSIEDNNLCTFWGHIAGRKVDGTYVCAAYWMGAPWPFSGSLENRD
jgi:hypothetical protein